MAKVKYYYDSENLAYRKIKTKKSKKFGYFALFLLASALFGFLCFVALINTPFFETPKDRLQTREIENLRLNYTVINKQIDELEAVLANVSDRDNNIYRVYFNNAPITEISEKKGIVTESRFKQLLAFNNEKLVTNTSERVDLISKQLAMQSKSLDDILKLSKAKEKFLSAIPAIQPVKNEDLKRMASGYGYRSDPFTKARKMHKGMDFTAPTGAPVYATGDGTVIRADNTASGFGNHIVIRHGYGYETLYAHLSRYKARVGQHVNRGDVIGFVGSTGRSEGPHCHYEVHKGIDAINPINFYYGNISAVEYTAIAKLAAQENQSLD
jgi:murein DD-endopeptidase MepM/ murein hydrolase activator NlpD